jgi:polyphosphate kinase
VICSHIFRVTRNADIERNEEEADDLLEMIEEELRERRFAEVVRSKSTKNAGRYKKIPVQTPEGQEA